MKQTIVALDLEGVLVPEIWIAVAEATGIAQLRRTTRDEPDFDQLMRGRIALLEQHRITMPQITQIIDKLGPLPGAREFLDTVRERVQVIILSDTFEQFAQPLMRQLGWPTLFCHRLVVESDRITGYRLRIPEQKKRAVAALQSLNYRVIAAGDSFNDTSMLAQASRGVFFRPPPNIIVQFRQFPVVESYAALAEMLLADA